MKLNEGQEEISEISHVGVLGAGVMGRGLAQVLAQRGFNVILVDVNLDALESAETDIRQNLRFRALFEHPSAVEQEDVIFGRIQFTTDDKALAEVQCVLENTPEKWEIKRSVFKRLDEICNSGCFFASNTSAIPIASLAACTQRPEAVIGMHFMNPAYLMPVVEVIRGEKTSEKTLQSALRLLNGLGKNYILVKDAPGFVSNRVLMLTINEAVFLFHEGVASAEDIDHLFKTCFGHRMGPLETADLIGLDTVLYSLEVLQQNLNESKYQPCPLLREMVGAGYMGRKSGQGFFLYPGG